VSRLFGTDGVRGVAGSELSGELAQLAWVVDGTGVELGLVRPGTRSLGTLLLLRIAKPPAQFIATPLGHGEPR